MKLAIVVLLVLANGFFVIAEFALINVRRTRIAELVTQGHPAANSVQKAINDPDSVIAATQLGITLSSLGLGWLGEPALSHLIEPVVQLFPAAAQPEIQKLPDGSATIDGLFTKLGFIIEVIPI